MWRVRTATVFYGADPFATTLPRCGTWLALEPIAETRADPNSDERVALAEQALAIRYPADEHRPFPAQALLTCRRPADDAPNLWHVFNSVQ